MSFQNSRAEEAAEQSRGGLLEAVQQSWDVSDGGPFTQAGPRGDEIKDVQGCDLLQMQIPHLCGPAASHSCYWTACEECVSWVNA